MIRTFASTTLRVTRVSPNQRTTWLFAFHSTVSFLIDDLLRSTKFPAYPEIPAVQSIVVDRRESSVTFALPKDVAQRSELPRLSTADSNRASRFREQKLDQPESTSNYFAADWNRDYAIGNALTTPSLGTSRACNRAISFGRAAIKISPI